MANFSIQLLSQHMVDSSNDYAVLITLISDSSLLGTNVWAWLKI